MWSARLDQQANRIVTASADYNVYAPPRSFSMCGACGSIEANEPHAAVRCGAR